MSVTIYWRRLDNYDPYFKSGTSNDLRKLEDIFGAQISGSDVDKLRAMATVSENDFFNEVADIVQEHGSIEFYGKW